MPIVIVPVPDLVGTDGREELPGTGISSIDPPWFGWFYAFDKYYYNKLLAISHQPIAIFFHLFRMFRVFHGY